MTAVHKRPGLGRFAVIAAIVGATVLIAGAGWFVLQALTAQNGAASPEEATDALIDAINNEDFLAMAELLEPGERRAVAQPILFEIVPELERIGVLDESFDSGDAEGVDFELTDVTYRVDRPADSPDVALVYFTGGTGSSALDLDELRVGSRLRQELDGDPGAMADLERTETADLDGETPVVMVERDGRWYVSLVYTVMEGAFPGELPAQAAALAPIGADSPEAAVEQMLTAAVDLDLTGMIQRMEPGEMHALHRYSPLFLTDAQAELDELAAALAEDDASIELSDLDLRRETVDGRTIVRVRGFAIDVRSPDIGTATVAYGPQRFLVDIDAPDDEDLLLDVTPRSMLLTTTTGDEATRLEVTGSADGATWTITGTDGGNTIDGSIDIGAECWPYRLAEGDEIDEGCLLDELGAAPISPADIPTEFPGVPMVVVETDGAWYVSPVDTVMYGILQGLRSVDADDVENWIDGESAFPGLLLSPLLDLSDLDQADDVGGGLSTPSTSRDLPLTVVVGETVVESQTLAAAEQDRWTFDLPEGGALAVTLNGAATDGVEDPALEIWHADGTYIGSNDDFEGFNSALRFAADPGTYLLVVVDLRRNGGDYELTVEAAADVESLTLVPDATVITTTGELVEPTQEPATTRAVDLTAGAVVITGSMAVGTYDAYTVTADGRPIVIELVPSGDSTIDPLLAVNGADGVEIGWNDDDPSGELPNLSSRIVLDAPTGDLTIEARSFGDTGGAYEIRISNG
ncbi:MAG: hypothetical protein AAGD35_04140 [Actinomycetota bacterium]